MQSNAIDGTQHFRFLPLLALCCCSCSFLLALSSEELLIKASSFHQSIALAQWPSTAVGAVIIVNHLNQALMRGIAVGCLVPTQEYLPLEISQVMSVCLPVCLVDQQSKQST